MDKTQTAGVVGIIILILMVVFVSPPGGGDLDDYPNLHSYLNGTLIDRDGNEYEAYTVKEFEYVMLYFSASWCPPCRKFTPELVNFYKKNAEKYTIELVFVCGDKTEEDMMAYMKRYSMPWLAVPFSDTASIKAWAEGFCGKGIPDLLLFDKEGNVIAASYDGDEYLSPYNVLNSFPEIVKKSE